jgi:hypothetical protein
VIMPTGTPVSSLDRTPQPPTITSLLLPMSDRDNAEPNVPGVSDFVLGIKLGSPSGTH